MITNLASQRLNGTGNGNKLSKLTAPDGSVVTYTYDNIDEYLLKEISLFFFRKL